jgi:SAM-dependent methyltransferase
MVDNYIDFHYGE